MNGPVRLSDVGYADKRQRRAVSVCEPLLDPVVWSCPNILAVVLVEAFRMTVAFRMANGRKDQFCSDHQRQAQHRTEYSGVVKSSAKAALIVDLSAIWYSQVAPNLQ